MCGSPEPSPISPSFSTRFSRKAVGWALEHTLDASLAMAALDTALDARKPQPGSLIHHSDRGVQYASIAYRQRLADHDIAISMSRPGNPLRQRQGRELHEDAQDRRDQRKGASRTSKTPGAASMASSPTSTTRSGCTPRSDTNRLLSSKPRSRKTERDNASWQPHCHRNYRVSFQGCSPVLKKPHIGSKRKCSCLHSTSLYPQERTSLGPARAGRQALHVNGPRLFRVRPRTIISSSTTSAGSARRSRRLTSTAPTMKPPSPI